ncbi:hypothetical protein GT002_08345 [Streptomyces sp. SID4917]|uniref:hypothetical protein n=2 Tax=unclassified Streptomyces TaxID=2593676 RepID=UPI00114C8EF6|nr:hypothetical protein [Streptomyces sp. MnatMP-M17]MYZ35113.1 hypothetical protein [Streptomyces sp. SID4917]
MIWSATMEELVVTAAAVIVLTAARRPLWECLVAVALMRTLPHLYYGLSALALIPMGIGCAGLPIPASWVPQTPCP